MRGPRAQLLCLLPMCVAFHSQVALPPRKTFSPRMSSVEDVPAEDCEHYVIKEVPTEAEMLSWAKELDEALLSAGGGDNVIESFRRGTFTRDPRPRTAAELDVEQKENMKTLASLLVRRGQPGAPQFSAEELDEIRGAMRSVEDILEKDENGDSAGAEEQLNGDGGERVTAMSKILKGTQDPVYGTVEKYRSAGVDISAGDAFVGRLKESQRGTAAPVLSSVAGVAEKYREDVVEGMGGFAAVIRVTNEVLVALASDGVGTKASIARAMGHPIAARGLGQDLVAMIANDLICVGAEPAYMLDYIAAASLQEGSREWLQQMMEGVVDACRSIGVTLVGGETAEMPGLFRLSDERKAIEGAAEFDIAGFGIGFVREENILPRNQEISAGDALVALPSSGLHSNGFSLVRKLLTDRGFRDEDLWQVRAPWIAEDSVDYVPTIGSALLTPTTLYVNLLRALVTREEREDVALRVLAVAHITGGGILGNVQRILPNNGESCLTAEIDDSSWTLPRVFQWLQQELAMTREEMASIFNCGVGMVICVSERDVQPLLDFFHERHVGAWKVGYITTAKR